LVGTSFATALLISFWNASVGAPFGSSWPFEGALPIWIAVALTLAFLLFQGLSQSLEMRLKPPARKIFDLVPSLVGLALVPLLIRSFFPLALLAGVGLWVLGQVPNRSVLRSVRLLPYPLIIGSLSATAFNLPTNWFSPLLVQITLYMAGLVFMVTSIAGRWRAAVPLAAVVGLLIAFILRSEISTELLSVAPTLWSAVMIAFCVLKDRLWFMRRSTTTELAPR
jgi:hypothetical protein